MSSTKVVEVRLGVALHDLKQEQVFGLLRSFPDMDINVGLGYGGEAAAIILDVPEDSAEELASVLHDKAEAFMGKEPTLVEILDTEAYEARALAEMGDFA